MGLTEIRFWLSRSRVDLHLTIALKEDPLLTLGQKSIAITTSMTGIFPSPSRRIVTKNIEKWTNRVDGRPWQSVNHLDERNGRMLDQGIPADHSQDNSKFYFISLIIRQQRRERETDLGSTARSLPWRFNLMLNCSMKWFWSMINVRSIVFTWTMDMKNVSSISLDGTNREDFLHRTNERRNVSLLERKAQITWHSSYSSAVARRQAKRHFSRTDQSRGESERDETRRDETRRDETRRDERSTRMIFERIIFELVMIEGMNEFE